MKYLLFMFGDVDNPEVLSILNANVCKITSGFSNYVVNNKSVIYYLDSELPMDDLDYFVLIEMSHLVDFYFIFPGNKKFAENLDEELRFHLFEEDSDNIAFGIFEDEESESHNLSPDDNLDRILDKIKNRGADSLTKEEKEFLNAYAQ